jgi:hypothetical protein
MNARIGELTAALEHERAQARRLVEALAREQALRALPAPTPTVVPETVIETRPETGEAGKSEHQAGPDTNGASAEGEKAAAGHEPARRRHWWQMWQRKA